MAVALALGACGDDTASSSADESSDTGAGSTSTSSSPSTTAGSESSSTSGADVSTDGGESSTGDTGSSTGDTGSSTGDTGSSTGDTGSSTGDTGSSTGEIAGPGPDLQILYEWEPKSLTPRLDVVDLVDGALTDPSSIDPLPSTTELFVAGERWMGMIGVVDWELRAYDLDAAVPFEPWPIEVGADLTGVSVPATAAGGSIWLVETYTPSSGDLQVIELSEDGPGIPWIVDGDLRAAPNDLIAFVRDEQSVAFQSVDGEGNQSLWIGPANDAAPPLVEVVAIVGDELYGPHVPPAGDALVYLVGGPVNRAETAWYVDLASDPAGAPIELGLVEGLQGFGDVRWAPNGSGVAFRQSVQNGPADIAWVSIVDGVPAAPVRVSTGASEGVVVNFESAWSPDARWFAYQAGAPEGLFVAAFVDGVPSEPTTILDPDEVVGADFRFASDSQALYVGTEVGADEARVRRIALDGDAPGLAETISGPLVSLHSFELAADGRSLLYAGSASAGEPTHAWVVDLSGAVPAAPVQLDQSLADGEEVLRGNLSPTSTHALYWVPLGGLGEYRKVVVDLANGMEFPLGDGDPIGWVTMRPLPGAR